VHQNRDYGRGSKNCLHESMIPEWMDLVVWGNEHESQPALAESLVGTYRIFQPGSSVACSLVEGESLSCPKHMGLVEVKGRFFRMQAIPFTQVRPFLFSDICLASVPGLDPNDPKIEDQIRMVLAAKVREQILEARRHSDAVTRGGAGQMYRVVQPEKVLVRLRVDHTGFPTINQQRFGAQFVEEVANPSSILLFAKKKKDAAPRRLESGEVGSALNTIRSDDDEAINQIRIEDLVKELLENSHRQLNVLAESEMAQAIDNFVFKKHLSAINDAVEETLERTQEELFNDISAVGKEKIAEHAARVRSKADETFRKNQKLKTMSKTDLTIFDPRSKVVDSDGDNNSDDDAPSRGAKGAGRGGGRGAATAAGAAVAGGRGGRGGRGSTKASKPSAAAAQGSGARGAKKAPQAKGKGKRGRNEYSEDSAEESEDYVSEEDEEEADDYGDSEMDISDASDGDEDVRGRKRSGAAQASNSRSSGRKAAVSSVPASVSVPLKVTESASRASTRPQRARAVKPIDSDIEEEEEEDVESVGKGKGEASSRLKRGRDASPPARAPAKRSGAASSSVQMRLDGGVAGAAGVSSSSSSGGAARGGAKKRVADLTEDW
jgi:double-strand break repair protein MRE11